MFVFFTINSINSNFDYFRLILRRVMVDFGIPIGYPKLYFKDGGVSFVNDLEFHADESLIAHEKKESKVYGLVDGVQCLLKLNQPKHPDIRLWLPYSVGTYLDHAQLISPEPLCWDVLPQNASVSTDQFVRWYHQLATLLPVGAHDEVNARLEANDIKLTEVSNDWFLS